MSVSGTGLFPPFPLAEQLHFEEALMETFRRVLHSGSYILGGEVSAFEREYASFLGAGHVIGVGSGTDAIEIMLRMLGIGPGHQVVVPALAPSAVAAGVTRSGAEPVFADIEPDTYTLCPGSLDRILGADACRGVKAVLAVHLYGHPADWESLSTVARRHGALLLEDCAQAHGAVWHGRMVGTLGMAAAFSFYPTKNLGALGDAGAVVTNDAELAQRARLIREYGWRVRSVSESMGVNSRLDELQAAVLRTKLPGLREGLTKRRGQAAQYAERLRREGAVQLPGVRDGCEHAFHQHVVRTARREDLIKHLRERGIPVAVHYPVPLHRQPAFYRAVSLPQAERAVSEILSLPIHPYLPAEAVGLVCDAIAEVRHVGAGI